MLGIGVVAGGIGAGLAAGSGDAVFGGLILLSAGALVFVIGLFTLIIGGIIRAAAS
jgi:hypothetical protein